MWLFGISPFNFFAIEKLLSGSSYAASVRVLIIFAPNALKVNSFSMLIFSGMTIIILYFLTAAANASPIPVFPEVASIRVSPGLILPSFSAHSTISRAIRSLTDPPGLNNSSFAKRLHSR